MGTKTGAAVVHAAKMPTQYIFARENIKMQCDGTMADVGMPAFTSKRSPRCFSDVLHDILEGNPTLQLVVIRPSGEGLEPLFEYTSATVDGDGRQETVYLKNVEDGCRDLGVDAPQGASRTNIICSTPFACPWKGIQVCQVTCTPSEVTPLTNGVNMGREQRPLGYG